MFSSALKSFTSNITSNYTLSPQPSSTSGPWKIFDAKRKSTGKAASVFVFDKKTLDPHAASSAGLAGKSSSGSLRRAQEEVIERLKKEASSLARLRHPSILELHEPVEETRNGGLMFATEPVTASLGSLLAEMDERGSSSGSGRRSRFLVEDADGSTTSRELELDELEIQKGLLQLGKGLEFLHESAGLVHANLTPKAVLVNAKGDWKISGLSFCGPHETSTAATSLTAISLAEVLNHDSRLPGSVQLDLDYTSPDFVLDNSLVPSADMFSLGLLVISLYNSPHASPLHTGGSVSSYKRLFASSSTIPTANNHFLVPSSHPLPPKLVSDLLPRLITRRPAQRLTAREFQDASFFDNILVSTIRFLDALPAKTAHEKAAFMRGLPRILPQFPKQVLEKKVLPALLEEMKDRDLLAPIVADLFAAVKIMPNGKKAFTEQVVPRLRDVFVAQRSADPHQQRDATKEAGLMVLLENMETAAECCAGREFREDILPIILLALESPTHAIVDAALGTLPFVLAVMDFSTIKNELFPVIAGVFAKTSSLNIKIRGLEAFYILCGGGSETDADGINGFGAAETKKTSSNAAILDKFTIQEKVVPLLKGIKTKEPGVMMAALKVFRQIGDVVDTDYLAMEVLPVLWSMSLGPLLNLQQFRGFMELIKKLGERIEREQTRKLQELRSGESGTGLTSGVGGRQGAGKAGGVNGGVNGEESDFESLVSGRKAGSSGGDDFMNEWGATVSAPSSRPGTQTAARSQSARNVGDNNTSSFAWQTPASPPKSTTPQLQQSSMQAALRPQPPPTARAITPDQPLSGFAALQPSNSMFSQQQPLQPTQQSSNPQSLPLRPSSSSQHQQQLQSSGSSTAATGTSIDWSAAKKSATASPWSNPTPAMNGMAFGATSKPIPQQPQPQIQTQGQGAFGSFSLAPPPTSPLAVGAWSSPPLQPVQAGGGGTQLGNFGAGTGSGGGSAGAGAGAGGGVKKSGLDRYESLL